ncbi:MAG: glycosyltransferase [Anaerolineae bacterium]|nr:glycosyltransferase [Anaerolineae bacterium]
MRILFTFAGGNGHFEPLLPIARAAQAAGHTVAFANRAGMASTVQAAGFPSFPAGTDFGDTADRFPLLAVDMTREDQALAEFFAGRLARERAADIAPLCSTWKPDLIVCDEMDFGSMLAAERLGIPYASVLVIASGSFVRPSVVADSLNTLRAELNIPPDPELKMLSRHLVLSPFPRSYRDPAFPLPPTAHLVRLLMLERPSDSSVPRWLADRTDASLVYFTLGTVFNRESGDLFTRVITGLRDLPINLVVTVGPHIDPAEFGSQPANVHIEQFIPHSLILSHCDVVVSHGGSGSVLGALARGIPSVLIPMGADQPLNAARCEALGVSRVLDPLTATPEMIREAVSIVLQDSSYRQAAERLRDEIIAMPEPAHAVMLLEQLAASTSGSDS